MTLALPIVSRCGQACGNAGDKANRKAGQKFSEWVQEMFPGLGEHDGRAALWFAQNESSCGDHNTESHPDNIRQWFNEQQPTAALPSDAPQVATEMTTRFASQRDAEKFIKTDQRAETGGEGCGDRRPHAQGNRQGPRSHG